jgi:hypothetical protein
MKITNTFLGGKMNVDLDQLLIPKGQYFKGLNIEVTNPENSSDVTKYADAGVLRNSLGNKIPLNNVGTPLTIVDINNLPLVNARCLGTCVAGDLNCIFFIITSTNEDLIVQYIDTPSVSPAGSVGAINYILRAPKPTVGNRYLSLNSGNYITGFNYMDNYLMWTDNLNPPRMINVTRFRQYTQTNFAWNQDDINVIVKPPLGAAVITLSNDGTPKNEIKNKFLYFSYRYKYEDNRWSTFAPFTQVAFTPASFAFNGQSVVSMYNIYNKVAITVATGDRQVTDIQFLFKDSEFSNIYIIETVNKLKPIVGVPVIPNNSVWTYPAFDNSKTYATLPEYELTRLFDNVPIKALAQDIIGSRLVYGNYTQFYNLITSWNSIVIPNYTVQAISTAITGNSYRPSFKTNVDYEFAIVYLDDYGRMSTPITSVTNTVHISAQNAGRQNWVKLTISHYPPSWAAKYRIFIKQSRFKYYNVFPSRIEIPTDAGISYYLINPVDKDKITVGDSVLLKTDFSGITGSTTEYIVLEVANKSENEINATNPAGLYFKLAKSADPSIVNNLVYELLLSATLPALKAVIQTVVPLIINSWVDPASTIPSSWSPVVYYPGTLAALVLPNGNTPYRLAGNALAIFSHVAYSPVDLRYRLEYAGIVSGFHCLNYRKFDSPTNINTAPLPFRNAATNAPVLVTIKNPANVITLGQLYFSPLIQVFTGDTWRLNLYSNQNGITIGGNQIKPIAIVAPITTSNIIQGGSTIKFGTIFDGAAPLNGPGGINYNTPEQSFVSPMTYPDLQEWFWESGAYQEFRQNGSTQNEHKNVFFRYGVSIQLPGLNVHMIQKQGNQVGALTSPYEPIMLIGSAHTVFNTPLYLWNMRMDFFRIFYTEFPLCFEVYPANQRDPLFHECTENLSIITANNKKYHGGYLPIGAGPLQNQTDNLPAAVFLNPGPAITSVSNASFNCWSFPNGVELNRIGDTFNKPTTEWSPRVMIPVLDYAQQNVSAGLTYSGTFRVDSNINNLNSFNLSLGNFKYLEKSFGSVQKIKSRDTDMVVFQQDQVSKVLYGKNLLSDSTGGGDITSVPEVLGTQISYAGEYGISNSPESFAQWGDDMYFADSQRGAVIRLNNQGLFDISQYGMKSFFNTNFKLQPETIKIGVFDPYYKRYILCDTGFKKSPVPPFIQLGGGIAPPAAYAYTALINQVLLTQ